MASRGKNRVNRKAPFVSKDGFQQQPPDGVHDKILKQARQSGQLNLSGRNLENVPDKVWHLNVDLPEEARQVSLDNTEDRWWEQTDLTKLILASNIISSLSEDICNFPALTVLDVHDNRLDSLPSAVGLLENLTKLDISRNVLKSLPLCVCKLKGLVSLHLEHNNIGELTEDIGNLYRLEDLDISNNQLQQLPKSFGFLSQLRRLNISNNKITALPTDIGCMNGLRYFDATHNLLKVLPAEFGNLGNLELLYLRHNKLDALPVLVHCGNLKELHVGNNNVKYLTSEHLQHLTSVNVLDLRDNKVMILPDEITLLEGLQRLDLTNNDLSGLPYTLGTITSLKSVVLDGNPMKSIRRDIIKRGTMELKKYLVSRIEEPEALSNNNSQGLSTDVSTLPGSSDGIKQHDLHQFKILDYSNKKVAAVEDEVWKAAADAGVHTVNLNKNNFTEIPEQLILLCSSLKELNFGFNKITSLTDDIGLYLQLTMLDLRCNQLQDLPTDMSSLKNLREIILSSNRFNQIPSVLFELKKLEILFLNDNKIDKINVTGLLALPSLATLDLQNNNCTQIPPELGNCLSLKSLHLGGNPCRNPRPAVLTKSTPAILEYLRSRIVSS